MCSDLTLKNPVQLKASCPISSMTPFPECASTSVERQHASPLSHNVRDIIRRKAIRLLILKWILMKSNKKVGVRKNNEYQKKRKIHLLLTFAHNHKELLCCSLLLCIVSPWWVNTLDIHWTPQYICADDGSSQQILDKTRRENFRNYC